jgi:hypothetical protein
VELESVDTTDAVSECRRFRRGDGNEWPRKGTNANSAGPICTRRSTGGSYESWDTLGPGGHWVRWRGGSVGEVGEVGEVGSLVDIFVARKNDAKLPRKRERVEVADWRDGVVVELMMMLLAAGGGWMRV